MAVFIAPGGGELELQNDLLRDFAGGALVGVDQHVGLPVERRADFEQFADFFLRVGIVEQGPVRLVADAFPDFFRRRPEAHDERVSFQRGEIFRIGRQAAAGGNHGFMSRGQFADDLPFQRAESRFAVLGKNVGNGPAGAASG